MISNAFRNTYIRDKSCISHISICFALPINNRELIFLSGNSETFVSSFTYLHVLVVPYIAFYLR